MSRDLAHGGVILCDLSDFHFVAFVAIDAFLIIGTFFLQTTTLSMRIIFSSLLPLKQNECPSPEQNVCMFVRLLVCTSLCRGMSAVTPIIMVMLNQTRYYIVCVCTPFISVFAVVIETIDFNV